MAISWGAIDKKTIETGVDRGVLYTGTVSVPWDGLISVTSKAEGQELTQHHYEGVVYHVSKNPGNYNASIEAYSYPFEFEEFQGMVEMGEGFYAGNQFSLKRFGFSYRTLIADGINGLDSGYKIHLVYNAIAIPTDKAKRTINESIEATNFTWDVVCSATYPTGFRPTAHFVIDSRRVVSSQLKLVEKLIYGGENATPPPSLPDVSAILSIINAPLIEVAPGVYDVRTTPSGWVEASPGVYDTTTFPSGWTEVSPAVWEEPNV